MTCVFMRNCIRLVSKCSHGLDVILVVRWGGRAMHAALQQDSSFCCFSSPQIKYTYKQSCFLPEPKVAAMVPDRLSDIKSEVWICVRMHV